MAKFCGKCGARMENIDRVCGYCGTPADRYEVLPEDIPRIGGLPELRAEKTKRVPEPPTKEVAVRPTEPTVVYERKSAAVETEGESYIPSDEDRRSRNYTIEDIPAVAAQQRSTQLIIVLSIIAAVLIAIGAFIYFVFRPFDEHTDANSPTETTGATESAQDLTE